MPEEVIQTQEQPQGATPQASATPSPPAPDSVEGTAPPPTDEGDFDGAWGAGDIPLETGEEPKPEAEGEPEEVEETPRAEAVEATPAEDDDVLRGKELLGELEESERTRIEAEAQRKADAARAEAATRASSMPNFIKAEQGAVDGFLKRYSDPAFFTGEVTLNGEKVNMGQYLQDNPEIPVVAGIVAHNFVQDLVDSGVLLPAAEVDRRIQTALSGVGDQFFNMEVTRLVPDADPESLIQTPEFKEWRTKAPKEINVLFNSSDPKDHARALNRFLRDTGQTRASKEAEVKGKATIARDRHLAVHKADTTPRSRASGYTTAVKSADAMEAEFEDGFASTKLQ